MNTTIRRRSLAARLAWMNAVVSGLALLLAYVSFLTYDLIASRQAAVNSLTADAQIVGANSASALIFNDQSAAEQTLSALSSTTQITAAAIFTNSGELFARYPVTDNSIIAPPSLPSGVKHASWKNGIDVLVANRIIYQGKPEGVVYIQAHLSDLRLQAIRYALITAAILGVCLAIALFAGNMSRRLLSEPIVSLARTARLVSRYRDYSLRFEPTQSYNELISLTEAFNEMLTEIQGRDAALEQARNDLEHRVEERTAQLRAANRELESFSYTVAHDLRGPLEIISNISYIVQHHDPSQPAEELDPMLARLGSSVTEMSNIIDDLLNLSRATSAGLHLQQIDLGEMASSILDDLAAAYPERQVEIAVQPNCTANADKGLMHIVLQNLLRNAWKFTGKTASPKIQFGCTQEGPSSVFFVRDNGAGFDQRMADRLFKPFQRLHSQTEFSGTGIGLATVQRVIARHNGRIWAEGEPQKGATFYFTVGNPAT